MVCEEVMVMMQDCRVCFGGAIGKMALWGLSRRRFCDFWCFGREEGESMLKLCGTDANVLGLWASIESAVYGGLKS